MTSFRLNWIQNSAVGYFSDLNFQLGFASIRTSQQYSFPLAEPFQPFLHTQLLLLSLYSFRPLWRRQRRRPSTFTFVCASNKQKRRRKEELERVAWFTPVKKERERTNRGSVGVRRSTPIKWRRNKKASNQPRRFFFYLPQQQHNKSSFTARRDSLVSGLIFIFVLFFFSLFTMGKSLTGDKELVKIRHDFFHVEQAEW